MVKNHFNKNQMKTRSILVASGILLTSLFSCEPYEEYVKDFDYTVVYFGSQKPLRTIVAYDDMQFKVGVTLGGKRENTVEEFATFEIDPSLLENPDLMGDNNFTLIPPEYYSLSNANTMVIPKGRFIGDVTVTLNREAFTSDPLANLNTYALPLRLITTSADSISSGTF